MQISIPRRWWVAIFLLATNCRSQQAAYSFRDAPVLASSEAAVPKLEMADDNPTLPTQAPIHAPTRPTRTTKQAEPRSTVVRLAQQAQAVAHAVRYQHQETAASRPKHTTDGRDTRHLILGAVLVVAGVVAGILLGGWLGLGVGALVVLSGYYFVVLGLGGRNAWLEVFQEFFNM